MTQQMQLTMTALRETIGNVDWLNANESQLLKSIPLHWTCCQDLVLPFGFQLKLLGCDWRKTEDVIMALYWLTHIKWIEARQDPHGNGSARSLIVRRRQGTDRG